LSRTAVNVTGDLTACLVMDRWVGGKKTSDEEKLEETARDEKRACDDEDVVCDEL
jgi:Na+/H+-dicarboxylate symporter